MGAQHAVFEIEALRRPGQTQRPAIETAAVLRQGQGASALHRELQTALGAIVVADQRRGPGQAGHVGARVELQRCAALDAPQLAAAAEFGGKTGLRRAHGGLHHALRLHAAVFRCDVEHQLADAQRHEAAARYGGAEGGVAGRGEGDRAHGLGGSGGKLQRDIAAVALQMDLAVHGCTGVDLPAARKHQRVAQPRRGDAAQGKQVGGADGLQTTRGAQHAGGKLQAVQIDQPGLQLQSGMLNLQPQRGKRQIELCGSLEFERDRAGVVQRGDLAAPALRVAVPAASSTQPEIEWQGRRGGLRCGLWCGSSGVGPGQLAFDGKQQSVLGAGARDVQGRGIDHFFCAAFCGRRDPQVLQPGAQLQLSVQPGRGLRLSVQTADLHGLRALGPAQAVEVEL